MPEAAELYDHLQQFDSSIPTEEVLTDKQIINLVQAEEIEEDNNETSGKKLSLVSTSAIVSAYQNALPRRC